MLVLELFLFIPVTRGEKGQRGARGEGKTRGKGILDGRERILMSLPLFSLSSDYFFSSAFCLLSYLWVKLCRGSSCSCSWIRSKLQSHLTWLQQLSPIRTMNLSRNFLTMCNRRYQQIFLNIVPSLLPSCLPSASLPACLLTFLYASLPCWLPAIMPANIFGCIFVSVHLSWPLLSAFAEAGLGEFHCEMCIIFSLPVGVLWWNRLPWLGEECCLQLFVFFIAFAL